MVAEAGQPVVFAEMAQYAAGIALSRNTIDLFVALVEEEPNPVPVDEFVRGRVATSFRRYEPVGVVTAITPYNGAIIMAFQKLIPALLAGNSVILRPTRHSALFVGFRPRRRGVGLPAGVLSVVVERGASGAESHVGPPCRHGVVHRLHSGGPADPRPGGADREGVALRASAASRLKIYLPDALHRVAQGAGRAGVAMTRGPGVRRRPRCWRRRSTRTRRSRPPPLRIPAIKVGPPSDTSAMVGPLVAAARHATAANGSSPSPKSTVPRSSVVAVDPLGSTPATTSSPRSSTSPTTRIPPHERDLRPRAHGDRDLRRRRRCSDRQ